MSTKRIDLRFNFSSTVPSSGGANKYRDTVPGIRLSEMERNKYSLSGRRFEEYERVMEQISEIIGTISFDDGAFAPADRNIGGYLEKIKNDIININARIDSGSFPVRETFGTGIFRNFAFRTPESNAVIKYNEKLFPGLYDHSPEFDIINIETISNGVNRFYLTGGKVLFPRGIGNISTRSNLYAVDIQPPRLVKNVEFSISENIFPMDGRNNVNFVFDPTGWNLGNGNTTACYTARLPIRYSNNGLPLNYPIEPGQMGGNHDAKFIWLMDEENNIIAHLEPTIQQIRYETTPTREELIIKILPSVFTDKTDGRPVNGNPKCYIYYMSPAWRYDTIAAHPVNGIIVVPGQDYAESVNLDLTQCVPLYFVMVNTYHPENQQIISRESWVVRTGLPVRIYHGGPKLLDGDVIDVRRIINQDKVIKTQDIFNIHSVGKTLRFQPVYPNGRPIKKHNTTGGILQNVRLDSPDVTNPENNIKVFLSNNKQNGETVWTPIGNPVIPEIAPDTPVIVNGVSFRVYYYDGSSFIKASNMANIAMSPILEYRVLYEDEEIFRASTQTPGASIPMENLTPGLGKTVKYKGTQSFNIEARVIGNVNNLNFMIIGDNQFKIGNGVYLSLDTGESAEFSEHLRIISKNNNNDKFNTINSVTGNEYTASGYNYETYASFVSEIDSLSGGIGLQIIGTADNRSIKATLHVRDKNQVLPEVKTVQILPLQGGVNHFGDLNSSTNIWLRHSEIVSRNGISYLVALIEFEMSSNINDFRCAILVARLNLKSASFIKTYTYIGNKNNGLGFGLSKYIRMKSILPSDKQKLLRVMIDDSQNLVVTLNGTYATTGTNINEWSHNHDTLFSFYLNQNLDLVFSNEVTINSPNIIESGLSTPVSDITGKADMIVAFINNENTDTRVSLKLVRSDNFVKITNTSHYRSGNVVDDILLTINAPSPRNSSRKILDCIVEDNFFKLAILDSNVAQTEHRITIYTCSIYEDNIVIHERNTFTVSNTVLDNRTLIIGKLYSNRLILATKTRIVLFNLSGDLLHSVNVTNSLGIEPFYYFGRNALIGKQYNNGQIAEEIFEWDNPKWISTFFIDDRTIEIDVSNYMVLGHTYLDSIENVESKDIETYKSSDEYTLYSGSSFDAGGWKWRHGPIGSASELTDYSGRFLVTPVGSELIFTVSETLGEKYVPELEDRVLCISWKSHAEVSESKRIGSGKVKVFANGTPCKLIHRIPGKAWVYVKGLIPGSAELSIHIVNEDSQTIILYPPTITTGWSLSGKTATEQMLRSSVASVIRRTKDYNDVTNTELDNKLSARITKHANIYSKESKDIRRKLFGPGVISYTSIEQPGGAGTDIKITDLLAIDSEGRIIRVNGTVFVEPETTGSLCVKFNQGAVNIDSIIDHENINTAQFEWLSSPGPDDIVLGIIILSNGPFARTVKYSYIRGPEIDPLNLPPEGLVRKDYLNAVETALNNAILDERSERISADENKNFIKTVGDGSPQNIKFRVTGTFLYWSNDDGVNWYPFG
jgi:hypothetical protein